jgi:hypothetical protein
VTALPPSDHDVWAELAAGHALSALDDTDEAVYLEHAVTCSICRELERDLSDVMAEVARLVPPVTPPTSLKAAIMQAIGADESRSGPVIAMAGRRSKRSAIASTSAPVAVARSRVFGVPLWVASVAAAVIAVTVVAVGVIPGHKAQSIAAQCKAVNCPVINLTDSGQAVAAVMVLDDTAYLDAHGLPATPAGDEYVLWSLPQGGPPTPIAGVRTDPHSGPVKVGAFTASLSTVSGFAVSQEHGTSVPSVPSQPLLAQGKRA